MTEHDWEREMTSEFDRRVRDLHEAPLTLDAVRGRATRIRRTRRAAVAGGVLAVAAVVVPVAVLSGGTAGETAPDPVQPATTATTAEPVVPAYVEGRTFHATDGSVTELPEAGYREAVPLGDQLVAYRSGDDGRPTLDVIGADGAVVDTYLGAQDPVVSANGDVLAFLTSRGEVRVLWDGGETTLSGGFDGWTAQAVDGGPDCAADDGCRVFLRDELGPEGSVVLSAGGTVTPVPDVRYVVDSDGDGRLAVVSSSSDTGACGGLVEEGGSVVFDQCTVVPETFSPDGRHLLGRDAESDGIGYDRAVVLDSATGSEVATLESGDGFVNRSVWVDDDTIAAAVFDETDQTWSVLALTIGEDAPQTVLGPIAGNMDEPAYRLVGGS